MINSKKFLLLVMTLAISPLVSAESNNSLRVLTTEYHPYSYSELGRADGYSVKIIQALLKRTQIDTNIEILPWARTYKTALNRPNTLIFSIARTPEREDDFHWIGKLFPMKTYFYIASDRTDINIETLDDARKYVVAGVIEGAPSKWLAAQGVPMFNSSGVYDSRIRMLINHRIDVLLSDPMSLETEMDISDIEKDLVKPILYLPEPSYDLYFALSKESDTGLIDSFIHAYKNMVEDGQYKTLTQEFHDRYEHLSVSH